MRFPKSNRFAILFTFTTLLFSVVCLAQQPAPASTTHASQAAPPTSIATPQAVPSHDSKGQHIPPTQGLDPKTGIPLYETIQEDWSSLQIGASKLEPEPPVVGDLDEQDHFIRQLVIVKWRPGDPIDLWIAMPKGVKNPPVVLYLYGHKEDTERFRDNRWCERVTSGGVAAVGFVSA